MIRRKFVHALRGKRSIDMNAVVFQQDRVLTYCLSRTLEYLRKYFPGYRFISRQTNNPCPHGSPNLNSPNYLLWLYLKDRVYGNNPQTTEALKDNIRREIRQIPQKMFIRVVGNFNIGVAAVIQQRGAWIEHIINYCKSALKHYWF